MPDSPVAPIALVTGAGRGIGRAVAVHLASSGHRVALTARSVDELAATARECNAETLTIPGDITDPTFVEHLYAEIEATWAPVNVLVANAGAGHSAPLTRTTDADWQRMIDLNLTAPFRCIRRALPAMLAARQGRIVAIASIASKIGEPYIAAYTASKHGLLGLVRSTAAEVATKGVTVNAICPGYVDTPMTATTVAQIAAKTGRTPDEARQLLQAKQANGHLVSPDEVAAAVMLCVGSASINGQGINVDGGSVQS